MLKPAIYEEDHLFCFQPPSGGCVLKPIDEITNGKNSYQPPSGGCVLKLFLKRHGLNQDVPAAFGRLCVETTKRNTELFSARSSRLRAAVC